MTKQNYLKNYRNYLIIKTTVGYKPFFANEVNLSGAEMLALALNGFVKATGATKKVEVQINERYSIKVNAKEWQLADDENFKLDYFITLFTHSEAARNSFFKGFKEIKNLLEEIIRLEFN